MSADPIHVAALALFLIGTVEILIRRSLIAALLALNVAVFGAALLFCAFALERDDVAGLKDALIITALATLLSMVGAAVAITIFRRRATIHLDELRELRG